jgi:hypothetical protein
MSPFLGLVAIYSGDAAMGKLTSDAGTGHSSARRVDRRPNVGFGPDICHAAVVQIITILLLCGGCRARREDGRPSGKDGLKGDSTMATHDGGNAGPRTVTFADCRTATLDYLRRNPGVVSRGRDWLTADLADASFDSKTLGRQLIAVGGWMVDLSAHEMYKSKCVGSGPTETYNFEVQFVPGAERPVVKSVRVVVERSK